jgi:F-type H+-transporting ATPase subunit delta
MAEAVRHETVLEATGITARLAKVYAQSLMAAAVKAGQVDALGDEYAALVEATRAHPRVAAFLGNPTVNRKVKTQVLEKAVGNNASELLRKFIGVLNENGRLGLFGPIEAAYRKMREEAAGRVRVRVTSATELSADQLSALTKTLKDSLKSEPVVVARVNPDLLGGLVVQVGDKVFDTSVRSRLDNLRNQLMTSGTYGSA